MMAAIRERLDRFFGRGESGIFVPVMDGALKPNERLDTLDVVFRLSGVDNLTLTGGHLLASSGAALMRLEEGGDLVEITRFAGEISALAADQAGRVAVGLASGRVMVLAENLTDVLAETTIPCPTALLFGDDGTLWVASGSARNRPDEWQRDLITHGKSGGIYRWNVGDAPAEQIARGLAWPYGLVLDGDGGLIVSESWAHRLVRVTLDGATVAPTGLKNLPGYPARIIAATGGGFWLTVFAPRNQLVEFVLKETEYRERMVATIDPKYWIAPCLRSGKDFREQLQGGGVKQMGVLKPWAPTRSYGLVVKLDPDLMPVASLHSRANGHVHGITSLALLERAGGAHLLIGAKGDNAVIMLPEKEASDDR